MTLPIAKVPDTRINRHIGRLRKAMDLALKKGDPDLAYRIGEMICRLEGWTSAAKVQKLRVGKAPIPKPSLRKPKPGVSTPAADVPLEDMFGKLD